jgi:hypothetical protein
VSAGYRGHDTEGKRIICQPPSTPGQEYNEGVTVERWRPLPASRCTVVVRTAVVRIVAVSIVAVSIVAVSIVAVAGCSSSGGKAGGHSTSLATGASATASSGASSSMSSGASSGASSGPVDPATKAAITKAYTTFFANTSTLAQSVAALQHGSAFQAALAAEAQSSYAQKSSATVTSVSLVSPDVANVAFTINAAGIKLPTQGKAVRENGTWKVAAQTFCNLLGMEGHAPPQCKDSALVSLPS